MAPLLSPSPETLVTRAWPDYALLDSGDGRKLERYGRFTVVRPEPQCFWTPRDPAAFDQADAVFDPTGEEDDGRWRFSGTALDAFPLAWNDVRFTGRFTPFRHLAFFPEQAANWAWMDARVRKLSRSSSPTGDSASKVRPRILNLFGYTGVASLALAAAGAEVTHVDASKKSVTYARENAAQSGLQDAPIRWIVEDARKYVAREVRRGSKYHGIVLDPPKYGRGPTGEVWRLFEDLPGLLKDCAALLGDDADFLLLNAYAARISGLSLAHLMAEALPDRGGRIDWGELALSEDGPDARAIGLSFFARWSA
ncbi:MAG: class I SAM-dependent methyltransferase [Brevundimonas sp.]|uniref:class I SAM-dependent methyltransferase n=1 Tax=Brevundimonas sp. TaxID=1871086 RepID=UPI0025C1FD83|nr:class I SAM-dependent methyltransferase [Brevundimonas sp.]MBX3476040.1 class I SAM-dependent methyltransferase [Brevundimonas sp.]